MRKIEPEFITGMGYIGDNPGVLYHMGGAGEQTVVTGNPALLEGVKGNRFTSLTLHGKSTQGSTTGAQLFDVSEVASETWLSTEEPVEENAVGYWTSGYIPVKTGNYICSSKGSARGWTYDADKNELRYIANSGGSPIPIKDGEAFIRVTGANTAAPQNFMFNEGNSIKPYEPYTGGKPSPSPEYPQEIKSAGQDGEIEVEVLGKNLIPFPYPILGGAGTQIEREGVKYTVQSDGGIRCVGTPTAIEYINLSRIKFSDVGLTATHPTDGKIVLSGEKMNYDPNNHALFIYITSDQLGKPIDTVIYPQIEFGTVDTEYEPYKPAQMLIIPTSGGLPGIPVSSGGNYTDEKGQQWVADEIDLARGERVKWIGEYELTGKESVADFGLRPRVRMVSITIPDAYIDAENHGILKAVMSNKYKQVSFNEVGNNINLIARGQQRNICISIPTDIGIEDFKTDLSNQYASGHPVKVFYKLDTPIRTPLPPETIAAYKALRTYSPTTTVINDAGAGMSVGYKRRK